MMTNGAKEDFFFKFGYLFVNIILNIMVHLQLLPKIGYIPHVVPYILEPVFYPIIFIPLSPPPHSASPLRVGNH